MFSQRVRWKTFLSLSSLHQHIFLDVDVTVVFTASTDAAATVALRGGYCGGVGGLVSTSNAASLITSVVFISFHAAFISNTIFPANIRSIGNEINVSAPATAAADDDVATAHILR